MAAMSITLDSLQVNTPSTSPGAASGYFVEGGVDWGIKAISDIVNSGEYRLEEMDSVLAAGRVLRQVIIPILIIGTSSDDLDNKVAALNTKLSKSNRYSPTSLIVTPAGSSATSTFKVVGGSIDDTSGAWAKTADAPIYRIAVNLVLYTLPFVYGAKQTLGSSGSPLLTATSTPAHFTVTPTAVGDVLGDTTIIVFPTVNALKTLFVADITSNTNWLFFQDFNSFTTGGGATYGTVSNAKYHSGTAVSVILNTANTLTQVLTSPAFANGAGGIPTGFPMRLLATIEDVTTVAANRGLNQIRANVNGVTGDWCACPPGAYSGASHYTQTVDLGTFTFPPGPVSNQVTYAEAISVIIEMQTSNASPTQMNFDGLFYVPDLTSLIAEYPGNTAGILTNNGARVENDMVYDTNGLSLNYALTGAHVRCQGSTEYWVYGSQQVMASQIGDMTYETVKAWAEHTPRYLGLAPA